MGVTPEKEDMVGDWNLNAYCQGYHNGYDRPGVPPKDIHHKQYYEGYKDGQQDCKAGVPKTIH